MKKIFKLALVTAAACGALVFTGCTKDLKEDISTLKSDLSSLKTSTVASLEEQQKALATAKSKLEAQDVTLQGNIDNLKTQLDNAVKDLNSKIAGKATSGAIDSLRTRATLLESAVETLEDAVKANESSISIINTALAQKVDKASVLEMLTNYATLDVVSKIQSDLSNLTTKVSTISDDLKTLDLNLSKQLNQLSYDVKQNANDIKALYAADEKIIAMFNDYYTKGVIDARLKLVSDSLLTLYGNLAAETEARKAADEALEKADAALAKKLADYKDSMNTVIAGIKDDINKLNGEVDDLKEADKALGVRIDTTKAYLEQVIVLSIQAEDLKVYNSFDTLSRNYQAADAALAADLKDLNDRFVAEQDKNAKEHKAIYDEIYRLRDSLNGVINDVKSDLAAEVLERIRLVDSLATTTASDSIRLDEFKAEYDKMIDSINNVRFVDVYSKIADLVAKDKELDAKDAELNDSILSAVKRITALEAQYAQLAADLEDEVQNRADGDKALLDSIKVLKEDLAARVSELKLADKGLQDNIDAEEAARKAKDDALEGLIKANADSIAINKTNIANNALAIDNLRKDLNTKVDELNKSIENALKEAKAYSDINFGLAKTYADSVANAAKTYADGIVAKLETRVVALETGLSTAQNDIRTNSDKIGDLQTELNNQVQNLQAQIDNLDKSTIPGLTQRVDDLENRITSISVLPAKQYELMKLRVGDSSKFVFVGKFQVEPKEAVEDVELANFTVNFINGIERISNTKYQSSNLPTEGSYPVSKIITDPSTGVVTAIVKGINVDKQGYDLTKWKGETELEPYFSLTYTELSKDGDVAYTTTSDYAEAVNASVQLHDNFHIAKGGKYFMEDQLADDDSTDYSQYQGTTKTPFAEESDVLFSLHNTSGSQKPTAQESALLELFGEDTVCTPAKFAELTGLVVNVTYSIDTTGFEPGSFNNDTSYTATLTFKDDLRDAKYLKVWDYLHMDVYVNDYELDEAWTTRYVITKKFNTVTLPTMNLYWNFKAWKAEDRKASIDTATLLAIKEWKDSKDLTPMADQSSFLSDTMYYNSFVDTAVSVIGKDSLKYVASEMTRKALITKQNETDTFVFNTKVIVDAQPSPYTYNAPAQNIDGSITQTRTLSFTQFGTEFVKHYGDTLKSGLTGVTFDMLRNAVFKELKAKPFVSLNSSTSYVDASYDAKNDVVDVTIKAGYVLYDTTHVVVIRDTVFGLPYEVTCNVIVGSPKFKLVYNPIFVDSTSATVGTADVRGTFPTVSPKPYGTYAIDQMHYTNYWKFIGDFSDEEDGTAFKLVFETSDYVEADEWGEGDHGAINNVLKGGKTPFGVKDIKIITTRATSTATPVISYDNLMDWASYHATYFTLIPRIYVNDVDATTKTVARKSVKFVTPDPLKFADTTVTINVNRSAGVNYDIKLYDETLGLKLKGQYYNVSTLWTGNLINQADGTLYTDAKTYPVYTGAEIDYAVGDSITTVDKKFILVKGQDYNYDDSGMITLLAESAISESYEFIVDVTAKNPLDHGHYAIKVPVCHITVKVSQNK